MPPTTFETDKAELLRVSKQWWDANQGLDIPAMRECFPEGMNYLMFNLNGCPYFGIDEKVKLWEHLKTRNVDFAEIDVRVMRLEIRGDTAWIAAEAQSMHRRVDSEEYQVSRIRATEIYHRDDGAGRPTWRMWHFHCSFMPDEDAPRVGFDETFADRGLGGSPLGEPIRYSDR